jgi:hypothetical protein
MGDAVVKELAYKDDVAALATSGTPADIGTTAALGDGTTAARENHVHALGSGVVDAATIKLDSGVLKFQAVPLASPGPTNLVQGMMYLDSGKLYVCTASYSA